MRFSLARILLRPLFDGRWKNEIGFAFARSRDRFPAG